MDEQNENSLFKFREQWKKEIDVGQDERGETSSESVAAVLFQQAVDLERNGKVFDAIRLYRRAIQIEPNIEFKIYHATKNHQPNADKNEINNNNDGQESPRKRASLVEPMKENCEELKNLVEYFSKQLENRPLCQPSSSSDTIRTEKHISSLPVEVMLLILKFVVSNDLDLRSLERFGMACKGFFILSRENELWRKACEKVWKNNLLTQPLLTWRDMFINRSRLRFDGCYISKITYQRLGENSFQDQFYRPLHLIVYYRLLRFFPCGEMIMMTSADDLQMSVNKLQNKRAAQQSREILNGKYHYQDNHVLIVIKKKANANSNNQRFKKRTLDRDDCVLTFFLELEICGNSRKRKFTKLLWKSYSVSQIKTSEEINSDYDLRSAKKYPPFFFSHVKSYHAKSYECLQ